MGLDAYIYKTKKEFSSGEELGGLVRSNNEKNIDNDFLEDIRYFRKFHYLNMWVCDNAVPNHIYEFNCEYIELTEEHFDKLFKDMFLDFVEETESYDALTERQFQNTLQLIVECKEILKQGYSIYYWAWW